MGEYLRGGVKDSGRSGGSGKDSGRKGAKGFKGGGGGKAVGGPLSDIAWALINSAEFLHRH